MTKIGIVCGMVSEVETLGAFVDDERVMTAVSAADPRRAEAEAQRMVEAGCAVLVSWGLAGGLDPVLGVGEVIAPGVVVQPNGEAVEIGHGPGSSRAILGSDSLVNDPVEKARLHAETRAVAVDMESHRLARVARKAGVKLHVIRAISDPAARALPLLAATALGEDGKPRIWRVLLGLLRDPRQLPGLIAAGRDSSRALAALRRVAPGTMKAILRNAE